MPLNIFSATQFGCVLTEFKKLLECEVKEINCDAFKFSQTDHHVESFYFKQMNVTPYKELSFIVKVVLALNHGQVFVECGFNINNFVLKTRVTSEPICHCQKLDCKQPKKKKFRKNFFLKESHSLTFSLPGIKIGYSDCAMVF